MQGIGQLLWKLREKEGIRQKQLCLGISSVSKYARIEADQQEIDFFLIDRIMGRLGKSVERLTYILPRDIASGDTTENLSKKMGRSKTMSA